MKFFPPILTALLLTVITACSSPREYQADVIVVGAGIAGLAAAIEARDQGAKVIVIDANSVGGGHAVQAGGLALVDTGLQRDKGIEDSTELAVADMLAFGETADRAWVKRYAEQSGPEVYDWLTDMGVEFKMVLPTPETSVPRFHFTRGTAVHVVIPMMREAMKDESIQFFWSTAARSIITNEATGAVTGVGVTNLRNGGRYELYAPTVILATGGYQSNPQMVNDNWSHSPVDTTLTGSGAFADGSGYQLAALSGAGLQRMQEQVTFVNGIPDPRAPGRGLTIENRRAVWVNAKGERFVDERLPAKQKERAVFNNAADGHWLIVDSKGIRKTIVRGAAWVNPDSIREEVLGNPDITTVAYTTDGLAEQLELPALALARSLAGQTEAPYYALQLYPLTRKSLGGPAIDESARVVTAEGQEVPGLYAAGELTGVAGINGSYGGSGTFLGPAVLLGRIAGRAAAKAPRPAIPEQLSTAAIEAAAESPDGYWHYKTAHDLIHERELTCETCHNVTPMAEISANADMRVRLNTCTQCH